MPKVSSKNIFSQGRVKSIYEPTLFNPYMLKTVTGKLLTIDGVEGQLDLIFQMVTPSPLANNTLPINKHIKIFTNSSGDFSIDLLSSPEGINYSCTIADRQVLTFTLKDSTPSPYFLSDAYPRII